MVAWELTRACNLRCAHCRASAESIDDAGALSAELCLDIINQIKEVSSPVLILTGGEPLLRPDIYEIAGYATSAGLRAVLGTNGTLITPSVAANIKNCGISAVGISIDFPQASLQDDFRGVRGAFDSAIDGIRHIIDQRIPVQINSTVTRLNAGYLDQLLTLALESGAKAFHPFLLVPTGRGEELKSVELSAEDYEKVLNWVYEKQNEYGSKIFIKPTDAPHYMRVIAERTRFSGEEPASASVHSRGISRGCLAGTGFCFISHTGIVQGCGYLTVPAGDLNKQSFKDIWENSTLFNHLRNVSLLKGKCGKCKYVLVCGGCRARAFEATGDYLESEPYCLYQPVVN